MTRQSLDGCRWGALLGLVTLALSCDGRKTLEGCATDRDCKHGRSCIDGECRGPEADMGVEPRFIADAGEEPPRDGEESEPTVDDGRPGGTRPDAQGGANDSPTQQDEDVASQPDSGASTTTGGATSIPDAEDEPIRDEAVEPCDGDGIECSRLHGPFTQVSAGNGYSCALKADGELACWGYGGDGADDVPIGRPPEGTFVQVSVGGPSACAIHQDGSLSCWGDLGGTEPSGTFVQVSVYADNYGDPVACAIEPEGSVLCWGPMGAADHLDPPPEAFEQVTVGDFCLGICACGIRDDGAIDCWGASDDPTLIALESQPPGTFVQLSQNCALAADGSAWCAWSFNEMLEPLGDSDAVTRAAYTQIDVAQSGACALTTEGLVDCWGYDFTLPDPWFSLTGEQLDGASFVQVSAGDWDHVCALSSEGAIACWSDSGRFVPESMCNPVGEVSCVGSGQPVTCDPAGVTTYLDACGAQACVDGSCQGECAPDSSRCADGQVETCDSTGTWMVEEACPHGCATLSDQGATCRQCGPGESSCNGTTLQICSPDGFFVDDAPCPSACLAGVCVEGECEPGIAHCQGSGLEVCTSEGTWAPSDCPRGCENDSCIDPPPECEDLQSCCFSLSGIDAITCENVAELGSASGCQSTLDGYRELGACF